MLHKGTDTYFNIIKSSFSKILCLRGACQELSVLRLHCQVRHPSTWTQHMSRSFYESSLDQATMLSQSNKVRIVLTYASSEREHDLSTVKVHSSSLLFWVKHILDIILIIMMIYNRGMYEIANMYTFLTEPMFEFFDTHPLNISKVKSLEWSKLASWEIMCCMMICSSKKEEAKQPLTSHPSRHSSSCWNYSLWQVLT